MKSTIHLAVLSLLAVVLSACGVPDPEFVCNANSVYLDSERLQDCTVTGEVCSCDPADTAGYQDVCWCTERRAVSTPAPGLPGLGASAPSRSEASNYFCADNTVFYRGRPFVDCDIQGGTCSCRDEDNNGYVGLCGCAI